jgi:hypothetical protein
MDTNERFMVLVECQHDIHENIKFADQKAAAIIGINTLLLGIVFDRATKISAGSCRGYGLVVCILLLIIGIGFGVSVIRPRGRRSYRRGEGLVDPNRIAQHDNVDDYHSNWQRAPNDDVIKELCIHIYDRSSVNKAKYSWLGACLCISLLGWIASLVVAYYITFPDNILLHLTAFVKGFAPIKTLCGR